MVLFDRAPKQSTALAPAIEDDAVFERLVACGDYKTIALVVGSRKSSTPVKHQRLELELFQAFADIARVMAAPATVSPANLDKEVLKYRGPGEMIFARKVSRGSMRRYRQQLGFARVH